MKRVSTANVVVRLTAAGSLAMMLGGMASADSVSNTDTGSNSNQQTTINVTNDASSTTDTNVVLVNENLQTATSGSVDVTKNTSVDGVTSGAVSNNNATATTISVGNTAGEVGGMGGGTGTDNNGQPGDTTVGGMGGGATLGVQATGGMGAGATLPEVGASSPIDVSALRSLYQAATASPTSTGQNGLGWLVPAFLLSALAGIGSVVRQKSRHLTQPQA